MDELFNQTRAVYVNDPVENHEFSKKIAFNCIPHIDTFMDDGFTKEEWKMTAETRKILDPEIDVVAHCVRVPVFIGHSEAVFIETKKPIDEQGARDVLSAFPGVIVVDHRESGGYVTPEECAGEDGVYISRLRRDPTVKNGLIFWCVADNLRKGAALNAVQIAETLVKNHLKKAG
jgi:aspartate-semialdehyde dehydrogenase